MELEGGEVVEVEFVEGVEGVVFEGGVVEVGEEVVVEVVD